MPGGLPQWSGDHSPNEALGRGVCPRSTGGIGAVLHGFDEACKPSHRETAYMLHKKTQQTQVRKVHITGDAPLRQRKKPGKRPRKPLSRVLRKTAGEFLLASRLR